MNTTKKQALAITPRVGMRVGRWRITDRKVAWDHQDEGWSLEVSAVDDAGNEGTTRVVLLEPMLADPKAGAYVEVILEEALNAEEGA